MLGQPNLAKQPAYPCFTLMIGCSKIEQNVITRIALIRLCFSRRKMPIWLFYDVAFFVWGPVL
jgi:hypothetical protein